MFMKFMRLPQRAGITALLLALVALAACSPATDTHATASPTVKPSMVYVAIGASDAVGVGASDPNTTAYVPLLIAHLPPHAYALNLGVSGYTAQQALLNELPQALAAQPTLVTVWLVGNDLRQCTPLADYQSNLDNLLGQLQSRTSAQVFVANSPDMSLLPSARNGAPTMGVCMRGKSAEQIRALVEQWNSVIATVVAKHHQTLVDLFAAGLATHPEYVSSDGFHPSDAGYRALADLFWQQITAHHAVPGA
jgi:lysophospholipase L1-like esterase